MKKKFLLISSILLTLIAFYGQAWAALALTTTDSYYLGKWIDGAPAGDAKETYVVNQLISMAAPSSYTFSGETGSFSGLNGDILTRSDKYPTGLVEAVFSGKDETGNSSDIDVTGTDYILAKYGNKGDTAGSEVWYVGDLSGLINLPSTSTVGTDISHYTLFTAVPLPSSFLFFGSGLLGLASFSRRKR